MTQQELWAYFDTLLAQLQEHMTSIEMMFFVSHMWHGLARLALTADTEEENKGIAVYLDDTRRIRDALKEQWDEERRKYWAGSPFDYLWME